MAARKPGPKGPAGSRFAQGMLRDMLADKQRGPASWRAAAAALAAGDEGAAAWDSFPAVDRDLVLAVVFLVRQALDATFAELKRPREERAERAALARVRKLAGDLDAAIRASSLPGDWVESLTFPLLQARSRPDVEVDAGWHSLRPGGYGMGYPLAVCDVLQWVGEAVERLEAKLPPRAAVRRHGRTAHLQIFVRHLAWQFNREFGEERPTTIAHIASALFKVVDKDGRPGGMLDAKAVEGFLKTRPKPFTPRKRKEPGTT